jgi:hypothetical protein
MNDDHGTGETKPARDDDLMTKPTSQEEPSELKGTQRAGLTLNYMVICEHCP